MLGLLKNGVSLRNTLFCYSIGVNEKVNFERLLYFPNKEEENVKNQKTLIFFKNPNNFNNFIISMKIDEIFKK